jgi:DNA mismatch endonuclease (patch repair protein)
MGYRYRLHRADLPGKPDLVFAGRRKVLFVHGCFWHGHKCPLGRIPKSRVEFWTDKIIGNRERDIGNLGKLKALGWDCLVVWECQLKDDQALGERIRKFLDG